MTIDYADWNEPISWPELLRALYGDDYEAVLDKLANEPRPTAMARLIVDYTDRRPPLEHSFATAPNDMI